LVVLISLVGCGGKLETPLVETEAGTDATLVADASDAEALDGGPICVPFDGSSPPFYTSGIIGCFSNGMTVNGQPACAPEDFSVVCVGSLPQAEIPSPPDAGDCTIIGIPSPMNLLYWCCRCAF
jgi:hypothetical protein